MRTSMLLIAGAVTSVLLLAGCGTPVPPGPSDAQIAAQVTARLDRQWQLSRLEGIIVRPVLPSERVVSAEQWSPNMRDCMNEAGVPDWGYDSSSGLFIPGDTPTSSEQLIFYWCFAQFPTLEMITDEQVDFVYDYYSRWLIPCLESNGYPVMNPPSREAFHSAASTIELWQPYRALERYPRSAAAGALINRACAATLPGIEGWSDQ